MSAPVVTITHSPLLLTIAYQQPTIPTQTAGTRLTVAADGVLVTPDHLCPDMLRWSNIGPADGWRGRVVRGFFWLMRAWPVRGTR